VRFIVLLLSSLAYGETDGIFRINEQLICETIANNPDEVIEFTLFKETEDVTLTVQSTKCQLFTSCKSQPWEVKVFNDPVNYTRFKNRIPGRFPSQYWLSDMDGDCKIDTYEGMILRTSKERRRQLRWHITTEIADYINSLKQAKTPGVVQTNE
tara:strand:- start:3 stop:464 length:462 start_codon:yes stop_codon:yes gene_type:complete